MTQQGRTEVLMEVAATLERLRQPNPINGDGSNFMLTRALSRIATLAGDDHADIAAAVTQVRAEVKAEDDERYERLRLTNEAER